MFIINGEPLHETTHPKEFQWMQDKFKEIRESGKKNYHFAAFHKRAMYLRDDNRMVAQKERVRRVSVTGFTEEPTGMRQTWSYVTGYNSLRNDGGDRYRVIRGTMPMEFDTIFDVDKDIELIFFFLYLSQNRKIRHVDHEANRRKEVKDTALQVKASSLIFNEDSPIHPYSSGNLNNMQNVALSWGVINALDLNEYDLMHELWNKVVVSEEQKNHTKRGYKEFVDEV